MFDGNVIDVFKKAKQAMILWCLERNDSGKQQALQLIVAVLGNPGLIYLSGFF